MTKSVAIYGFSPRTRHYINDSKADELWTLNNAYDYDVPMERVTRWYEIHADWQIFSENINSKHREFLEQEHPWPIYMQEARPEFPSSVAYPLDAVIEAVAWRRYLTNSIALMVAHAIYEGFDRIELYGVDLQYGTEYSYQKAGTEYICGFSDGRGIDLYLPPTCALLDAPIYAFDAHTQILHNDTIEKHLAFYTEQLDKLMKEYLPIVERHKSGDPEALAEIMARNPLIWTYDGAQSQLRSYQEYLLTGDRIGRQALERQLTKAKEAYSQHAVKVNYILGKGAAYHELGITDAKAQAISSEYDEELEMLHRVDGAVQATSKLIAHIDFRSYDLELVPSVNAK